MTDLTDKERAYLAQFRRDSQDLVDLLSNIESTRSGRFGFILVDDLAAPGVEDLIRVLGRPMLPGRPVVYAEAAIIHVLEQLDVAEDEVSLAIDVNILAEAEAPSRPIVVFSEGNCVVSHLQMQELH